MKKINIEGMSCNNCVAHVKEALEEIEGVKLIEVKLEDKNALVETQVLDEILISAIDDAGYDVISIDNI